MSQQFTSEAAQKNLAPVCIAGMHRSGTSMVVNALRSCGLYLGQESAFAAPSSENKSGYWENRTFVLLNEEILKAFGGAWDYPPLMPEGWHEHARLLPLRAKAEALLEQFAGCDRWGWKDPRNSLTLPFWTSLLPNTKVVICLRNPLEVALSLRRRKPVAYTLRRRKPIAYLLGYVPWEGYRLLSKASSVLQGESSEPLSFVAWKNLKALQSALPSSNHQSALRRFGTVMSRTYGELDRIFRLQRYKPFSYQQGLELWKTYNEHILEATSPQNRIITHYDVYFDRPQMELRRVLNFLNLPASDDAIERGCVAAVTKLRHNRFNTRHLMRANLPRNLLDLYSRMCREADYYSS